MVCQARPARSAGTVRRFLALWIVLGIFLTGEVVLRLLPMEFASGAGVFLTNHRRHMADAARPEFDYIILGDSRSLSLTGHAPTPDENWSVYNFSLPALGPRYFRFYLQKILANRVHKPAAVIFAGDPRHFQESFYRPHHDPVGLYSDGVDESLAIYLARRFTRRIGYAFAGGPSVTASPPSDLLWDDYSHRYMHLFSTFELAGQFRGAERIFILAQSLPLWSYTYRYRDGIEQYTFGFQPVHLKEVKVPPICDTCAGTQLSACYPKLPPVQDNRRMAAVLKRKYGGINIGDRLNLEQRALALMVREQVLESTRELFDRESPDLKELDLLLAEIAAQKIKVVLAEVPHIDIYAGTKLYTQYDRQVTELLKKHPHARRIRFPQPYYPKSMFIEQVHYSCEGARRLNHDFYSAVMPGILEFAPPINDGRERSLP